MNKISTHVLHYQYKDINEAIKLIPSHANCMTSFIQIFAIYIDNCKNTNNYNHLKTIMCDNFCNLCKMYHLLTGLGLLYIDCLKMDIGGLSNRILGMEMNRTNTIQNSVLYNQDTKIKIKDIIQCIYQSTHSKENLKQGYYMISLALYLRKEFQYFCDKSIDKHIKTLSIA